VNKLKKLLKKYDYLIEVNETDNGCVILTPENFFGNYRPPAVRAYNIVKDPEKPGISVSSNLHDNVFVPIPRYVIASSITWDIIKTCQQYNYDVGLVQFIDIGGNYCDDLDFSEKVDLTDKEKDLKLLLDNTFLNQVKTDFKLDVSKELKQFGIGEGYEILVKLFRSDEDE
jgi:hypothetical protein